MGAGVAAAARPEGRVAPRLARWGRVDLLLVGITVLAAALRLWHLGSQSFWYDEWATLAGTSSGGLGDLVAHVGRRDGQPVSYFVLMWAWAQVFGHGEVALRMVSALAGIATVPVAYGAVRELGAGRRAARLAALLLAVHPLLVWYSQEARPYSLLGLTGAGSLWATARAARDDATTRHHLTWGLVAAAVVGAHYFGLFLVLAEAGLLVVRGLPRPPWRRLALGGLPVLVMLACLAPVAMEQASHDRNRTWIAHFSVFDRMSDAARSAVEGPNPLGPYSWVPVTVAAVVAALLLLIGTGGHDRRAGLWAAAVGGGAISLAVMAYVGGWDVFVSRYLVAAVVALVLAAAVGLAGPRRGLAAVVGMVAASVLVGVSLFTVVQVGRDAELQKADWRAVAEVAGQGSNHRLLLMNVQGHMGNPLLHYLGDAERLGPDETAYVDQIDVLVAKPAERPCSFLVGRACALLFLGAPLPAPLAEQFTLEQQIELEQFTVVRYRADRLVPVTKAALVGPDDAPRALAAVAETSD